MRLTFEGRFETGDPLLDHDLRDLQLISTDQGLFLCSINGVSGGVSVFRLTADRSDLVDSKLYSSATLYGGSVCLWDGETTRLYLHGSTENRLSFYDLTTAGLLSDQYGYPVPDGATGGLRALASTTLPGGQGVLYGISGGGQLQGWSLGDAGEAIATVGPAGIAHPSDALLAVAGGRGGRVLVVADDDLGGLASYRIDPETGGLSRAMALGRNDGVALSVPTALESFRAYGQDWALLAGSGSGSLTLFSVASDGVIAFRDHLVDTRATRFAGVQAVEVIVLDGRVFVVAAGEDDGLSLFGLLPEGRLIHMITLAHDTGYGLENVTALELAGIGAALQVFAASGTTGGLSRFTLPLNELGDIRAATDGAAQGGAGDDVLVQSAAGDRLTGAGGADIFVLRQLPGGVIVTDFAVGEDRLDLSLFDGLRNVGQLEYESLSGGARLRFGETTITIRSADGRALGLSDIWRSGFSWPDRFGLGDVSSDGAIYGGDVSEQLTGTGADDRVLGMGGDDLIDGRGGNDHLEGGDGNDRILGGTGSDTMFGGLGVDVLVAGSGNDHGAGGAGDDSLAGDAGDDHLQGDTGNDQVGGGEGNDILTGGTGHDSLTGDAGADEIRGGDGQDSISGGAGQDSLFGNAGRDTLAGGTGDDLLRGGHDPDVLTGGDGDDWLRGGGGDDSLTGGAGRDRLGGGADDDSLRGYGGRDRLFGGTGDDTLLGDGRKDRLKGGAGDDLIDGGKAPDLLWGGPGRDVFIFHGRHGDDRVLDFEPGTDRIDLSELGRRGADRLGDLLIADHGADLLIDTGAGTILLHDLAPADLSADDFLF